MIALVQRVQRAHVEVAGQFIGAIGPGLLVLVCASHPEVAAGEFGAAMQVHGVNDGPVTIPLRV